MSEKILADKMAVLQVIGCLIKNPTLLNSASYKFEVNDFPEQFHKIVFAAVSNLITQGAQAISYIDIDQFISKYPRQYKVFCDNDGLKYVTQAAKVVNEKNLPYYYQSLKKFSLLREMKARNFDISEIYDETLEEPEAIAARNNRFDKMTTADILLYFEKDIIDLREHFNCNSDVVHHHAGDDIFEQLKELEEHPQMGMPFVSPKLTTIFRGQQLTHFILCSSAQGVGKCLVNSSRIPTPNGWKTIGDIKVGDYLFDAKGNPTKVTAVFPQGEKEVYQVTFNDGRTVRCCEEHLWSYNTASQSPEELKNRNFKTSTLREIINKGLFIGTRRKNILVPNAMPVKYPEKAHSVPPYTFGLFLGDATSEGSKDFPELIGTYSHNKFIPREYLEDSIDNRFELLNGLLDIDGTIDNKGHIYYSTINPRLKDDIIELLRSLGLSVKVNLDIHREHTCYNLYITGSQETQRKLFKLKSKRDKLDYWLTQDKQLRDGKNYNAMVKIEDLGYKEEMTCFLVDNDEHLFLTDDFIVTHNSRIQAGESAHMAIPEYYNTNTGEWENTGCQASVLLITTELDIKRQNLMWLAYISGVPQDHIMDNTYQPGEKERVLHAAQALKNASLYLVEITNFDGDDLENIIKMYYQRYGVNYVYFDYLGSNDKILGNTAKKTRVSNLREDQILLSISTTIKNLTKQLGIYIYSSTQLSGEWKSAKEVDQQLLRGAKSLSDKPDETMILLPVRESDKDIIDSYMHNKGFQEVPTHVYHIYKNRDGKLTNVRLYVHLDLGTCRTIDCFVTNNVGEIIPVEDTIVNIDQVLEGNNRIKGIFDSPNITKEEKQVVESFEFIDDDTEMKLETENIQEEPKIEYKHTADVEDVIPDMSDDEEYEDDDAPTEEPEMDRTGFALAGDDW